VCLSFKTSKSSSQVKCADPTSLENDDMKLAAYMVDWLLRLCQSLLTQIKQIKQSKASMRAGSYSISISATALEHYQYCWDLSFNEITQFHTECGHLHILHSIITKTFSHGFSVKGIFTKKSKVG
jgi:hypothetical protein